MSDRGMKKWLPYKSLEEQGSYLNEAIRRKSRVQRPIVLEARAEKIDEFLKSYRGGSVKITFYCSGEIRQTLAPILKIDFRRRTLVYELMEVPFVDIIDVEMEEEYYLSQQNEEMGY